MRSPSSCSPAGAAGALAAIGLAFAGSGCAALEPEYGASAPVVSRYVFRGVVLNSEPALQPEAFVSAEEGERTWLAGVWTNFDLTDENGQEGELTEVDLYGEVARSFGDVRVALGLTQYRPVQPKASSTIEAYLIASSVLESFTPALELYYDVDEAEGLYANLSVSRGFTPAEAWDLTLTGGVGWMSAGQSDYSFGVDQSGLSDFLLQAAVEHPLGERAMLGITTAFSSVIDSDLRDAVSDPENLVIGISLGWTF